MKPEQLPCLEPDPECELDEEGIEEFIAIAFDFWGGLDEAFAQQRLPQYEMDAIREYYALNYVDPDASFSSIEMDEMEELDEQMAEDLHAAVQPEIIIIPSDDEEGNSHENPICIDDDPPAEGEEAEPER